MQKISDAPLTECPDCKEQALHKLVSAAAFHLKGSGWYVTDFKDKPKKADNDKQAADSKDSKPGGDSTKPEKQESKKSESAADNKTSGSNKSSSTTSSD